jgi:hypothetical protein
MAGKIVADTLEHSTAGSIATNYVVNGSAKAFVTYDADDHLEDDSFNISSLTDGTNLGETDVAFTNTMVNSDYITVTACLEAQARIYRIETRSTSGYTSQSANTSGTGKDDVQGHVTFGDLA